MGSHHSFDDKVVIPSLMRQLDMLGIEDNWDDQKGCTSPRQTLISTSMTE